MAASLENIPQKPNSSAARFSGENAPTSARPTDWLDPRLRPESRPAKRNICSTDNAMPNARSIQPVSSRTKKIARMAAIHSSSVSA